jgi:hypothetical protein
MTTSLVCSGPRQGTTKGEGSRNGKEPVGSKQLRHGRKREGKEKIPGRRFTAVTLFNVKIHIIIYIMNIYIYDIVSVSR